MTSCTLGAVIDSELATEDSSILSCRCDHCIGDMLDSWRRDGASLVRLHPGGCQLQIIC